jgi:hypothetical protein
MAEEAERAVAEIDRIGPRTARLAEEAAAYRAAMVSVAAAARGREEAAKALINSLRPLAGGPAPGSDPLPDMAALEAHVRALAEPCIAEMFSGLSHIFDKPDAGRDPGPARAQADCKALGKFYAQAGSPDPKVSISEHILACAAALEQTKLADPGLAEEAQSVAAQLRRFAPLLAGVRTPAAALLSLQMALGAKEEALREGLLEAETRAAELRRSCPARR